MSVKYTILMCIIMEKLRIIVTFNFDTDTEDLNVCVSAGGDVPHDIVSTKSKFTIILFISNLIIAFKCTLYL